MSDETSFNRCLASFEIEELLSSGYILPGTVTQSELQHKIQPSSFDVSLGNELFILDTDVTGIFRPSKETTIREQIKKLHLNDSQHVFITNGYELKKGYTYLIPIKDTIKLQPYMHLVSSPKSSIGRLFLNTRMLTDYNMSFNEIKNGSTEVTIELWLLVQPQIFNVIVHPGNTLNQIRFFEGLDAKLSNSELLKRYKEQPILYESNPKGELVPILHPIITNGLQIHLDLLGSPEFKYGGFRAKHNPMPIDLNARNAYDVLDYFIPIPKQKNIIIRNDEYYLFGTKETLRIPKDLNCELQSYSDLGFSGPLDFAGFIDNNFTGTLVLEARSDEMSPVYLTDGMPLSNLEFFRTKTPTKLYGDDSNYQRQKGPRIAKYFKKDSF